MILLIFGILFVKSLVTVGVATYRVVGSEVSNNIIYHSSWKLLNSKECGVSYSDRILGGKVAFMGAYPWIARLGYRKRNVRPGFNQPEELKFICGGSVISEYYIITAAHCIVGVPDKMRLKLVRLGEQNSETNPDCYDTYCNDPYVDYVPVKVLPHEKYNKPPLRNDIALIRVDRKIQFTDFIKPICIAQGQLLLKNFVGQTAEIAGWGVYSTQKQEMSPILQYLRLPVLEHDHCIRIFKGQVPIGPQQMCAGGKIGEDSCGGDSGGPLMKVEVDDRGNNAGIPRYYLIGIVSFGAKRCGVSRLPGVYTSISKYLLWILDHLEP